MSKLRFKLTYANVMASIAVFGVLAGGGAYAASQIGSSQIKKNAVKSKHIANGAVKPPKLAGKAKAMWADVNDSGTIRAQSGGIRVERESETFEGRWIVTFPASVAKRGLLVSPPNTTGAPRTAQVLNGARIEQLNNKQARVHVWCVDCTPIRTIDVPFNIAALP